MSELPKVWNLTELESLFSFVLGGDWGKAPDFSEEGYLDAFCIRGTEFKHWTRDKGITSVHRKLKASSLENRTLQLNDILIEISGGGPDQPVGRTVLIDEEALQVNSAHPKVCTNFIRLVRPSCSIHGPYLNYYLRSFYLSGEVTKYQGGSNNLRNLKFKEYSKIEVPVAPLNEQIRIANKLDSILVKVDKARARLDKIPAILKRFRQSVLAAATSGELTQEWREEYTPLKHPEVTGKYNLDWSIIEESNLPESWQWVALGNYAKCNRGKFSIRPRNDPSCFDGDYPFIQIGDLPRQGGYIYSHKQTLNEKGYSVSREFDTGTVVLAIVGATIANTGITTYPVCFPDSLVGISSSTDTTNKYLDYHLRAIKENIRQASYAGGGQPNIKLTMVNPLPLPLPPENEIVAIVDKVESLMARANKVEKQYLDAKVRLERLTQSILAKAFRGELVPQDPNDEPAEKLLERILAEKEQSEPKKTTRKRATKAKTAEKE